MPAKLFRYTHRWSSLVPMLFTRVSSEELVKGSDHGSTILRIRTSIVVARCGQREAPTLETCFQQPQGGKSAYSNTIPHPTDEIKLMKLNISDPGYKLCLGKSIHASRCIKVLHLIIFVIHVFRFDSMSTFGITSLDTFTKAIGYILLF